LTILVLCVHILASVDQHPHKTQISLADATAHSVNRDLRFQECYLELYDLWTAFGETWSASVAERRV